MGQSIPVGPWLDFETAYALGGNALKAAAEREGQIITEWAAVCRPDGLWQQRASVIRGNTLRVKASTLSLAEADDLEALTLQSNATS